MENTLPLPRKMAGVRLDDRERAAIEGAARLEGVPASTFMREVSIAAARRRLQSAQKGSRPKRAA